MLPLARKAPHARPGPHRTISRSGSRTETRNVPSTSAWFRDEACPRGSGTAVERPDDRRTEAWRRASGIAPCRQRRRPPHKGQGLTRPIRHLPKPGPRGRFDPTLTCRHFNQCACTRSAYPSHPTLAARVSTSRSCRYCCKSPKLAGANFSAVKKSDRRPPVDVASITLPRSPASLSSGDEVPHIFTRKSRVQPKEILIASAKRLLQQNRHEAVQANTAGMSGAGGSGNATVKEGFWL